MNYETMRDLLNLHPTQEEDAACRYLQSRGLVFCIDYGTQNAPSMAWAMLEDDPAGGAL